MRSAVVGGVTNREVAMAYLKHFCAGNVDGLASLLADDLEFKGPFHQFSSSRAYIQSLRDDPLDRCSYRVVSITEADDSVSVYYDYRKAKSDLTVAQLFNFTDGKISKILLVFDTGRVGSSRLMPLEPGNTLGPYARFARFEREAKVLASLNHPGIAGISGLEESGDTRALDLELVEGATLADRIAKGPIPLDEALPIAKQIAPRRTNRPALGKSRGSSLFNTGPRNSSASRLCPDGHGLRQLAKFTPSPKDVCNLSV